MAKKQASIYENMNASDLARITRERKLEKPNVITLREWADFLQADDAARRNPVSATSAAETAPTVSDPYGGMSADEAVAEASRRGMKTSSRTSKREAVDYLLASDGVSEDSQAALDDADYSDDEGAG